MTMEVQVNFYRTPNDFDVIDKIEVDSKETIKEIKDKLLVYYGLDDNENDPFHLGTAKEPAPSDDMEIGNLNIRNGSVLIFRRASLPPPPSLASAGLVLTIKEGTTRKILISPLDAEELEVDHGDLLHLKDPVSGISVVGKVEVSDLLIQGLCELDQMLIDSLGSSEDMEINAEHFDSRKLKSVTAVTFGVRPIGGMSEDDAVLHIRQRENELLSFMDKSIIMKGQKYRWDEEGVLIYILDTQPSLGADEVAIISNEILGEFNYQPWGIEPNFDGILLIDMSFSMNIRDMPIKSMDQAIKYLGSGFEDTETRKFLGNFKDGKRCRRLEGAVLAAIMYLAGKVGRGKGERVSIILFSSDSTVIQFGDAQYYDATLGKDIGGIASQILATVNSIEKLGTNMAGGLESALQMCQAMGTDKMKMIVLLTDGFPDDENRVRELMERAIAPRADIVLFAAGIGEEVNQQFMQAVSQKTGGEFLQIQSLDELTEWYSNLARKLEFKGRR